MLLKYQFTLLSVNMSQGPFANTPQMWIANLLKKRVYIYLFLFLIKMQLLLWGQEIYQVSRKSTSFS